MIKIKKNKYVYAQLKINNKVVDFYIGKVEDFDLHKFANIIKKKFDAYLSDQGVTHDFNNHKTIFGLLWNEEEKITCILESRV
jgi:hypothetical protein